MRVRAKNCSGWSEWSGLLSKVASFSDIPEAIEPASIICTPGLGCIELEWPAPNCRGKAIDQYRVTCIVVPSGCVPVAPDHPQAITRRQYELHPKARVAALHGGDAVFLAISAHNEAGNANDSAAAPPLFCLPSPPPPPVNITVKAVTATSVVLGWDAPAHCHGSVITQYRISQILPNGSHKSVAIPGTRSACAPPCSTAVCALLHTAAAGTSSRGLSPVSSCGVRRCKVETLLVSARRRNCSSCARWPCHQAPRCACVSCACLDVAAAAVLQ